MVVPAISPGSIVRARGRDWVVLPPRGRDWVVLPPREPDVVLLRPLTGTEDEAVGLFEPLEGADVQPSAFPDPDPKRAGDARGALVLRDAVRLGLRDGAAPFRSLGRISVRPRPYQFVPLLMALRLESVRLLIADDVGVGKTIEAGMIARELLDRGLARRLAVLCPPHLCEQWEEELREKFALETAVIQPARIARLERELPRSDLSIFQYYPHLVASIDFVKSDRYRARFLDNAPDLIVVDEAHAAARPRGDRERSQHQRYELLRELAARPTADGRPRHVLLVTATPHSGIEESFRSLLGLLDPRFDANADGSLGALPRAQLVPHVVQRRRSDVERWMGAGTPFPARDSRERPYELAAPYQALFHDVLAYCRELVQTAGVARHQQRVRHWAAIALLRCLLSSPDAAVAVLAERARKQREATGEPAALAGDDADGGALDGVDGLYRPQVLDPIDEEQAGDYVPAAPIEDAESHLSDRERRRLDDFQRRARDLAGPQQDAKLRVAADALRDMLRDGFRPIVFCRYIATAKYLEAQLPALLKDFPSARVVAVTGEIGDEERRERVEELARSPQRVLVATDCLSEGINLQERFDAVLHYDLPWNPNRLEQREGRVDRFGQARPEVRTVVVYGSNNEVDLIVLRVLVEKARSIRRQLGVAMPVPAEAEQVIQAVVDSVLLRAPPPPLRGARQARFAETSPAVQMQLPLESEQVSALHRQWDRAAERERQQRAYFAQHGIQPDEVAREIELADPVLGDPDAVRQFLAEALQRFNGAVVPTRDPAVFELHPGDLAERLRVIRAGGSWAGGDGRAGAGTAFPLRVAFDAVAAGRAAYLGRTHPLVAAVCDAVMGRALGPEPDDRFARCGAVATDAVQARTVVALLRLRYLLREYADTYAEEVVLAAYERRGDGLAWRRPLQTAARELLERARPKANVAPADRERLVAEALAELRAAPRWHEAIVAERVRALEESHARVRALAKAPPLRVEPRTPPDILAVSVLIPAGAR